MTTKNTDKSQTSKSKRPFPPELYIQLATGSSLPDKPRTDTRAPAALK